MRTKTKQQKRAPGFETSPERVALIRDVIDTLVEAGHPELEDKICQTEELRKLADRLRLPYLQMQIIVNGPAEFSAADVDEYNAWRVACALKKQTAQRRRA